ncbi:MAG: hypothetical protein K2P58_03960 [Hyphomonadaceae bacterium]|nr:hypothetical protein [Hyphomonadaceae bacterium]
MAKHTLLVSGGEVIEVQLTSETVVIDTPLGRRPIAEPGHITNRVRLFVRHPDGQEQKYDFEDTELGVRQTQRVGIARAQLKGASAPINLALFNLSSGERDVFEPNLRLYLGETPFFGPLWKAAGVALAVAAIFYVVSHFFLGRGAISAAFLAVMFATLTYPVFWWLSATWDRITQEMRYDAARRRFLEDMGARVR